LVAHRVAVAREQEDARKRETHRRAAELAAHNLSWNEEAVFARRLQMDKAFVHDGTVDVDVTARETTDGRFAGVIITSGGKELCRCPHHHSRQRRRGDRGSSARYESVMAARACAQIELSGSESHYEQGGALARKKPAGKRAAIRDAGDENVDSIRYAFRGKCAYCGGPEEVLDHVVPLFLGGLNSFDNILPACDSCNLSKGTRRLLDFLASLPSSTGASTPWIPSHISRTAPRKVARPAAAPAFTPVLSPAVSLPPSSPKGAPDWAVAAVAEESRAESTAPAQPFSDQTPWWRDDQAP
jgi:5-methylcytosine-specific restriction endonuclease McrA